MNYLLAQTAEAAAEPGRLLGLTVDEWIQLLPVLATAAGSVIVAVYVAVQNHRKANRESKKVKVLSDTLEEHSHDNPDQAHSLKGRAFDKATKAGIQGGMFGMEAEAAKAKVRNTKRIQSPPANGAGLAFLLCAGLVLLSGCAVGPKGEALIETECRAHDQDLVEWSRLTPEQRRISYEDSRAGVYEIRYVVLGIPLPPDLEERRLAEAAQ